MANKTAFEAITTRQSWYAGEAIDRYDAVEFGEGGHYVKATGSGIFAGICEYGAEAADRMITVVKGTFPAVANGSITEGAKLTIDSSAAGTVKAASASDATIGIALNAAAKGELVSVAMVEAPVPGAGA